MSSESFWEDITLARFHGWGIGSRTRLRGFLASITEVIVAPLTWVGKCEPSHAQTQVWTNLDGSQQGMRIGMTRFSHLLWSPFRLRAAANASGVAAAAHHASSRKHRGALVALVAGLPGCVLFSLFLYGCAFFRGRTLQKGGAFLCWFCVETSQKGWHNLQKRQATHISMVCTDPWPYRHARYSRHEWRKRLGCGFCGSTAKENEKNTQTKSTQKGPNG